MDKIFWYCGQISFLTVYFMSEADTEGGDEDVVTEGVIFF